MRWSMNDYDKIAEWARNNDIWYLKIDIDIPEECISEAQQVYEEGYFVKHRDTQGWASSSLHGFVPKGQDIKYAWRYTGPNGDYGLEWEDIEWGWSEIQELAPETKRWLLDFPHKEYARCRFMLLEPGAHIPPHNDSFKEREDKGQKRFIWSAINLAFTQPIGCDFRRVDNGDILPFKPCTGFWFDNGVDHEVINNSNENRFHFIIHGHGDYLDLAKKSLIKQYGSNVINEIFFR